MIISGKLRAKHSKNWGIWVKYISSPGESLLCERKCTKKRKCGRHKCNQKCCVNKEHNCNIICGKKLSCGKHKCDEVCHAGFCRSCWRVGEKNYARISLHLISHMLKCFFQSLYKAVCVLLSYCCCFFLLGFDELSCHCGVTVQYPPIPCSAKPPECDQPCARNHPCGHAGRLKKNNLFQIWGYSGSWFVLFLVVFIPYLALHPCHNDDQCPPCAVLTTKACMGEHKLWKNVPCHRKDVSCGQKCAKPLACGMHKCNKVCHKVYTFRLLIIIFCWKFIL